jgi:ZIP family zinc transporter
VIPGLATGAGGLALLLIRGRPTTRTLDALTGLTAGIMLAASIFSLLVPALDQGTIGGVVVGFLAGVAFLAVLDVAVPHIHERFHEPGHEAAARTPAQMRAMLLLDTLTIHKPARGNGVGPAFAAGGPELGIPPAVAIGAQNVPEGFAAAAPLVQAGASRRRAVGFAAATGAVEPPAALIAAAAAGIAGALLVGGLAFAAGAMVYVIVDELIPRGAPARQRAGRRSRSSPGSW